MVFVAVASWKLGWGLPHSWPTSKRCGSLRLQCRPRRTSGHERTVLSAHGDKEEPSAFRPGTQFSTESGDDNSQSQTTLHPCNSVNEHSSSSDYQIDDSPNVEWMKNLPTNPATTAVILLNLVAVLWGSQHAIIRQLIDRGLPAELVNLLRFSFATAVVLPQLPSAFGSERTDSFKKETLLAGGELAIWMFAGYALQSVGLITTSASRSGFLLYLNVKMVPILAWLLERRQIARETWISAGLALTGTLLLVTSTVADVQGLTSQSGPNVGDLWSIAAAAASACFIFRLEKRMQSSIEELEPASVNAVSLSAVTVMCAGWVAFNSTNGTLPGVELENYVSDWKLWLPGILYLGVITTAVSNWMQAVGQKYVSAQKAAIIYALDPVYGAGFAALLLGERLGPQGLVGAGVITIAALINQKTD